MHPQAKNTPRAGRNRAVVVLDIGTRNNSSIFIGRSQYRPLSLGLQHWRGPPQRRRHQSRRQQPTRNSSEIGETVDERSGRTAPSGPFGGLLAQRVQWPGRTDGQGRLHVTSWMNPVWWSDRNLHACHNRDEGRSDASWPQPGRRSRSWPGSGSGSGGYCGIGSSNRGERRGRTLNKRWLLWPQC